MSVNLLTSIILQVTGSKAPHLELQQLCHAIASAHASASNQDRERKEHQVLLPFPVFFLAMLALSFLACCPPPCMSLLTKSTVTEEHIREVSPTIPSMTRR